MDRKMERTFQRKQEKISKIKIKEMISRKRKISKIEEMKKMTQIVYNYCSELSSASTEVWISCQKCTLWAHNSCAGADDDQETLYL